MAEYVNKADMWYAYGSSKDDVDMAERFERLPTIDIVHCSECKWFSPYDNGSWQNEGRTDGDCMIFRTTRDGNEQINVESDWFCADMTRRD